MKSIAQSRWTWRAVLAVLAIAGSVPVAFATDWSSRLEDGGEVRVDPRTNRATITRDGVTTQAWDGVHRLRDGSTLTIRAGQAVPNEGILQARKLPPLPVTDQADAWVGTPIVGKSPCEKLVDAVCGADELCAQAPACAPARQLLDMERGERAEAAMASRMTYSSGQCMEAFKDKAFFTPCTKP